MSNISLETRRQEGIVSYMQNVDGFSPAMGLGISDMRRKTATTLNIILGDSPEQIKTDTSNGVNIFKEKAETQTKKSLILTQFNPEIQEEREQLLALRNETIIRGYDVLCAMFFEKGLFTDDIDFGRQWLERFGGLISYISEQQLSNLYNEKIYVIKNINAAIMGAYITTSNLTLNEPPSTQELATLGVSCGTSLIKDLVCKTAKEQKLRQKAIHAIMESQLVLCANLCTDKCFRRNGIGTVLKAVTFQDYLKRSITQGLITIFSIEGVYKKIGESSEGKNEYEQIHKFESPIQNVGSLELNKEIIEYMGYVPVFKKATEMIDKTFSAERTGRKISRLAGVSRNEVDSYYVRIDDVYYLTDLVKAVTYLKQMIYEKQFL